MMRPSATSRVRSPHSSQSLEHLDPHPHLAVGEHGRSAISDRERLAGAQEEAAARAGAQLTGHGDERPCQRAQGVGRRQHM
jgi:hypothetical protein